MITAAIQDYLKTIYDLSISKETVTTKTIADRLGVAQASVTGMVKKLAEYKLVQHTPYHGVALTESGTKIALEMLRHHRLLELYLKEVMGFSWDKVHDEAERLEHVISEEFEERMAEMLGHPTTDPHGAVIPSKNGEIEIQSLTRLSHVKEGTAVRIKQVSDKDAEKLRYLADIGLFPDVDIRVLEKHPFEGPLVIQLEDTEHHLGKGLTDAIFVSLIDQADVH